MKIFDNINGGRYQVKVDKKIGFGSVFKLLEECENLGLFKGADEIDDYLAMEDGDYGFISDGESRIGKAVFDSTHYFIHGSTCLVFNKGREDAIIRILVKRPGDYWDVRKENGSLAFGNEVFEVYDWWDVDWLGTGRRDYDSNGKPGYWWKSVYNDISEIYEYVAKSGVEWAFNQMYAEKEVSK